jgi:hypothetical protein
MISIIAAMPICSAMAVGKKLDLFSGMDEVFV